jgi:hypothetical protein
MRGRPVALDWLLVSDDLGAGARVTCALMQVPFPKIRHLKHAEKQGLVPALDEIALNRDIRPFIKERFALKRSWTDYPGLLTFHSPFLAYIGYFSPLAKILHRILYLFREPFYEYE